MSDNRNEVEMHGCIVCGRVYNVLAVYSPYGSLVDWTVSSPDAHILKEPGYILVACNSHSIESTDMAIKKWLSRNKEEQEEE
jgi:hypothetical protein